MTETVYNRLFTKILDSSIWLEPDSTRIVWVTLLASMDEDGYCHFSSLRNLASRANVSLAKAERAIKCFESPDADSENLENEGRRVDRVPGGYLVLNAKAYREKFSREIEKEKTRIRVARFREKNSACNNNGVTETLQGVSPASASSSVSKSRCTQKESEDFCVSIGLPRSDGEAMFLHWEEKGWAKVKDWRLTIRKWKSFGYLPSQKSKPGAKATFQKPISAHQEKIDREYEEARQEWEKKKQEKSER